MSVKVISLNKLALAIQQIPSSVSSVPLPTDHILVIDISGSMAHDLPTLRLQLKNKLVSLVKENDTVSILWFSGKGQYGTLVEQYPIRSVTDLAELHAAVDKYLQPICLTGFKEPLEAVLALTARINAKRSGNSALSLFFMTDGYDNQWHDEEILAVCRKLEPLLANTAVVEYGWNCNRPLLTRMSEALGGKLVFSKDLQEYCLTFENEISTVSGGKKKPVTLELGAKDGYVFGLMNSDIVTFAPNAEGVVMVPENVTSLAYFTADACPKERFNRDKHTDPLVWGSLIPLSQRMDANNTFEVLGALGDVLLVDLFSSCFSKEDYILFQNVVREAALNPDARYRQGYDANAVPKEDAYTVLEMLSDLAASDENLFYPYHPEFAYERIGTTVAQAAENTVSFQPYSRQQGYPISHLVWNESRPNVSIDICISGYVTLPPDRPAALPEKVETRIYRNYTVVRDGIVHTRKLPVSLSKTTFEHLQEKGLLAGETWVAKKVFALEYPRLPVINRQMVKNVTAKETFELALALAFAKGTQKVLNDYRKRFAPKQSVKFLALYGQEATDYLASVGVTEYNGFNPGGKTVKSGDFYVAKELDIAIKGLSSLPKVADVEKAVAAQKSLKLSEFAMSEAVQKVADYLSSDEYQNGGDVAFSAWLEAESARAVDEARALMQRIAKQKFSIVVGHTWFSDLPPDQASTEVPVAGFGSVLVTAKLADVQVER